MNFYKVLLVEHIPISWAIWISFSRLYLNENGRQLE